MTETPPLFPAQLDGFAFTSEPISRADALRDDPAALACLWPQARVIVLDAEGQAFANSDGQLMVVHGHAVGGGPGTALFLGLHGEVAWFSLQSEVLPFTAPQRIDLRRAAAAWPPAEASAFAFARAMQHWRLRTRFCGLCAGAIEFRRGGYVAHCTQCGNDQYPRVDPAVIVAVTDGQRLLLGRQPGWAARSACPWPGAAARTRSGCG